MDPREIVRRIETAPALPGGDGDRFAGYAVIGLPFRSGHALALRRFPASSIGPGYTSVWHRDPAGAWTFYSSIDPGLGCTRYFGSEVANNVVAPIDIEWQSASRFSVSVGTALRWELSLRESLPTRLMNRAAALMPDAWWRRESVLKAMSAAARFALRAGRMNLNGRTPNGQRFIANPQQVWLVNWSRCTVDGVDLGPTGALAEEARLNDFIIPQRGLFAVVRAFLHPTAESSAMMTRTVLRGSGT